MSERPTEIDDDTIATLAATVKAPESLHRRVQEMVAEAQTRTPAKRRLGWARRGWGGSGRRGAVAAAGLAFAAALAVVLATTLVGGGRRSSTPTPQSAAALALSPATAPAPSENRGKRGELTASVGGVAFPYWQERFGWRDSGARNDTLAGRAVTTVFYANAQGQRVGYAIVAGPAPAGEGSGAVVRRWGVSYRLSSQGGANVIAWRRGGHLCVIAGRGVSPRTLLKLASWGNARPHAA